MDTNLYEDNNNAFGPSSDENATMFKDISNYETHNKILLIEDNPGDARLVELLLGESDLLDCKITNKTTLADGIAALEAEDDFAAILLDLTLPDSRGFETLERLLEKFPDKNVIVLTGLSDKSLGINAVKAGAQDFLIKGAFDADLLAKSLRYSIERNSVLKRLEVTQRIANIGNWEYDPATKLFSASDEVFRIFGFTPRKTQVSPEDLEDANHPFHVFSTIHEATLANKEVKKDIQIKSQNGKSRYVYIQCAINKNTESKLVLSGILQDMTERKMAELEMIKSQERYQDIFTKSKDAIYISTLDGQFIDYNESTLELLGYTEEETEGLDIHQHFLPVESREKFLEELRSGNAVKDFEIQIEQKNKEIRYCSITANRLETPDFSGYNGIVRDITEHKQAERLRKARDLARQSAAMKEQFIASVSHEMRTPMNAILGMSNLVIQTPLNKEQHNFISSIKQSSEILLGVINDILEISTLQNGKIKFEYKNFNLHELLSNLVNMMQYKANEKDLVFELHVDDNVPKIINGDKLRLNQILNNLVGNAVKFTDSGFVKIYVKNVAEHGNKVQLHFDVVDTGIGIPADKLEAIFETFTRIRQKDRLYEGTGLGLSIAKNLVEQQDGKIGVSSIFGEGSCFNFDLAFEKGDLVEKDTGEPTAAQIELPTGSFCGLLPVAIGYCHC
ncbi:MAG: ATP-binding protein, partial [Bacteroidota bacterium]